MGGRVRLALHLPAPGAEPKLDVHGLGHRGAVRELNEDCWAADVMVGLALVADGVGGHRGGAEASEAVARAVSRFVRRVFDRSTRRGGEFVHPSLQEDVMRRAAIYAHRRLVGNLLGRGGSTLAGIWAPSGRGGPATIFHVGDSRVYLARGDALLAMTRDHSMYQEWADGGRLGTPPDRKYILQALGLSARINPAVQSFVPQKDDLILICSDGLSGTFDDDELSALLRQRNSPADMCAKLIDAAVARGAKDNVTAVLCAFPAAAASR